MARHDPGSSLLVDGGPGCAPVHGRGPAAAECPPMLRRAGTLRPGGALEEVRFVLGAHGRGEHRAGCHCLWHGCQWLPPGSGSLAHGLGSPKGAGDLRLRGQRYRDKHRPKFLQLRLRMGAGIASSGPPESQRSQAVDHCSKHLGESVRKPTALGFGSRAPGSFDGWV